MTITRFDPNADLIVVRAYLWGPRDGRADLRLALDTGAAEILIKPGVLEDLRYSVRDAERITVIRSAIGKEPGYLTRVVRLRALGHELTNILVHAHDLPGGFRIDGLLGLSFLKHFNYEIRSREGQIRTERILG